jgi:hydroxyacylglutathione hydrolase
MILHRFFTAELSQVAYAVGDAGTVAIIDPRRDVAIYVEWAAETGNEIVAVLETHVHADFVSGAVELARVTGAPIYASRLGEQAFEHVPVDDGMTLDIGAVRLTARHTPGHTPEHIAWMAEDTSDPDAAPVMFSGDALFVGDVGRPDLLGESRTQELVDQLYETVTSVFKRLPDDTVVYPGHTAGSSCGKNIGSDPSTTIRREKAMNYAFKPATREAFADAVMRDMPTPPAYYPVMKRVNKAGAALLEDLGGLHPVSVERLEDELAAGSMVIDVRDRRAFAAGHVPGSIFVGTDGSFATWMGWLAPYDRDLVLVADDADQAREAMVMLRRIGLDRVVGYHAGVERWRESGRPLDTVEVVSADDLRRELAMEDGQTVLDVRNDSEYETSHVDGARHHFLGAISQGEMPPLDRDKAITIVCGAGYRSLIAASLMKASGFSQVRSLAGGMEAWNEAEAGIRSIAS